MKTLLKTLTAVMLTATMAPAYAMNVTSRNKPQQEAHEQAFCTQDKKDLYVAGIGISAILIAGYFGGVFTHDGATRVATIIASSTHNMIEAARNFTLEDAKKFGTLFLCMTFLLQGAACSISGLIP